MKDRYAFHGDEREIEQEYREVQELKEELLADEFDDFLYYGGD